MLALRFYLKLMFRIVKFVWLTIWALYQLALGAVLVAVLVLFFRTMAFFHVREIRSLRDHPPATTAFIAAQRAALHDSLQSALRRGTKPPDTTIYWSWIPLDSIPKTLAQLAIVAEDAKFYSHEGFDWEQMEYAMVANHQAGRPARGASTITQQLAKNLYLNSKKDIQRKLQEAAITLLLENTLDKNRILEIYLNTAQFGPGVFGVREAALRDFHKPLPQLNQEEMLDLVCLLPAPTHWNPRRPSAGFLSHKRQVLRNYALFKGLKSLADTTAPGWMRGVYDSLDEELVARRWKGLRSNSPVPEFDSSTSEDTSADAAPDNGPVF